MRIGLTYDLRSEYLAQGYSEEDTAEFDRADTLDHLAAAIAAAGHDVDRVGAARALIERLARGDRWDLVFNICEGLRGLGREAQVPAILDVYGIPYTFADPLTASVALHKEWTKQIVRTAGIPTPASLLVSSVREIDALRTQLPLDFPLMAKPVAEGTGKGVSPDSVARSIDQLVAVTSRLLARYQQPVLIESFLPGREFTVGLLGTGDDARVLGSLEIVLNETAERDVYSYLNKEECEARVAYPYVPPTDPVVAEAERIALAAWRALDCRDAGRVDLRCDANGQPMFIEVNPLAGLHPEHSDLPMLATAIGMSYDALIGAIVASAARRVPDADNARAAAA
jgi:D-alanine-D-alanine ligase